MELSEIIQIGLSMLSSLGGAALILFAFSSWLGKVWASRILDSERSMLASELEGIKATNQNFINAVGVSNTLYIESQKAFSAERVNATKCLWAEVMKLRDNKSTAIAFLDILTFEEYGSQIYKNSNFNFFDEQLSIQKTTELLSANADSLRPFLDEKTYAYFWSYRALVGRLSYYMMQVRESGQPENPWQEDKGIIEIIRPTLGKNELERFQSEKWSTQVLLGYIETVLAQHLRDLASGIELSKASLDHSMTLHKAAENLRKIEENEKTS